MYQYVCSYCHSKFTRIKRGRYDSKYCSTKCQHSSMSETIIRYCCLCNKGITTTASQLKKSKSGRSFCSRSCSAKYNNSVRQKTRRSKIEIEFANQLSKLFPELEFVFNSKLDGYELDVYIPELKLAIEWNGVVHFQPIYGTEKLKIIQSRDYQKLLVCRSYNIDLVIIKDESSNREVLERAIIDVSTIITNKLLKSCRHDSNVHLVS